MDLQTKLKQLQAQGSCVLAANFYNYETLRGILLAAAAMKQPIILQVTKSSIDYMGLKVTVKMARAGLEEFGVEGWLHLDHSTEYGLIEQCLHEGFDSVMIDASEKSFVENVEVTRKVVELAKQYHANVEAELGYIPKLGQLHSNDGLTEPTDAQSFVQQTSVHALAVAIGSAHGFYTKPPKLDIARLAEIKKLTNIPLVLHGGSGIPAGSLNAAIQNGICKINLATEIKNIFMMSLKDSLIDTSDIDLRKVFPPSIAAVSILVQEKLGYLPNTL